MTIEWISNIDEANDRIKQQAEIIEDQSKCVLQLHDTIADLRNELAMEKDNADRAYTGLQTNQKQSMLYYNAVKTLTALISEEL